MNNVIVTVPNPSDHTGTPIYVGYADAAHTDLINGEYYAYDDTNAEFTLTVTDTGTNTTRI